MAFATTDFLMPQAMREIARRVPKFAEAMPENRFDLVAPMSNDLAYLAVEIALAHEVGHVFSGCHSNVLQGSRRTESRSSGAWHLRQLGRLAHLVPRRFRVGRPRQDQRGADGPGEVMRTLVAVRGLVAEHLLNPKLSSGLMNQAEELMSRGERSVVQLDNYLARAIREGRWPQRAQDEAIFQGLLERLGLYSLDFILFVKAFPRDAIEVALQVARDQQLS